MMGALTSSIRVTKYLLALNTLIWLCFSLIVLLDLHPGMPEDRTLALVMAALAFIAGTVLAVLTVTVRKYRPSYYLLVASLGLLALLSITDDFGLVDLAFLLVILVTIGLLIRDRKWYLHRNQDSMERD